MADSTRSTIEQHPDIKALRARSEEAISNPGAQAAEGLGLLTGLYIAASPWILGFGGTIPTLAINNLIVGLAFMFMLVGFGSAYERTHGMGWAAVGIGVWTIIAPWMVAGPTADGGIIVSNVLAGVLALLIALAIAALGMSTGRDRKTAARG